MNEPDTESWALYNGDILIGGAVIRIKEDRNILDLFFIDVTKLGTGYGSKAWKAIEKHYSEVEIWETFTPISLKQNLAFYVNNCGFKIV